MSGGGVYNQYKLAREWASQMRRCGPLEAQSGWHYRIMAVFLVITSVLMLTSCKVMPPPAEPISTAAAPTPIIATLPADQYLVAEVIDGDTIVLATGEHVRYIGINAPEPTNAECYAREATAKNAELVAGRPVRLEKDTRETDDYGRLLRYVYVDDLFVNGELVRLGYARARVYPPDVRYTDLLAELEREAQGNARGLWSACVGATPTRSPACIGPDDARAHVGKRVCVEFLVVRTHNSGRRVYLNSRNPYQGHLEVVIERTRWSCWPIAPERLFLQKRVWVSGTIELYNDSPQITLEDCAAISILE